jgi:1,4-dihydroxy-2-naphthoate octaprenyltransferase
VGKKTWVVRLAGLHDNQVLYDKPFVVYIVFNIISFGFIFVLALIGFFKPEYSTPFVLIALLPSFMVFKAVRWGKEWLEQWNKPDADRKRLPYELLKVNVSTIGVHFFTGLLLVLAYWLGRS